jgi:hypothetical protein
MWCTGRRSAFGRLGACVLTVAVVWNLGMGSGPTPRRWHAATLTTAPPPGSLAEVVLRQAWRSRTGAELAVLREREALERWDPQGSQVLPWEAWRLQRLAADPTSDLHKAWELARQAATLAHTPAEKYRAVELQVLLAHEAGRHEAEFQLAARLLALAPASYRARQVYKCARCCRARAVLAGRVTLLARSSRRAP